MIRHSVQEMNILGIIPARGGSKGIPKKNIKKLNGKSLIEYTLIEAKKSKLLSDVIVSTDDKTILKISEKHSVNVLSRPKKLSTDSSTTTSVLFHTLNKLKKSKSVPDIIVLLQPTSPLRNSIDIDNAITIFLNNSCDSVVSVTKSQHSPFWIYKTTKTGHIIPILKNSVKFTRRQDSPLFYHLNGAIFVTKTTSFFKNCSMFGKKILPYIMPYERSIDIDKNIDLKIAEFLLKTYKSI